MANKKKQEEVKQESAPQKQQEAASEKKTATKKKSEETKDEKTESQKSEAKKTEKPAQDKKEQQAEKTPREPQLVTVNGEKVTHAHAFQSNKDENTWYFTAKLDGKQLRPMRCMPTMWLPIRRRNHPSNS